MDRLHEGIALGFILGNPSWVDATRIFSSGCPELHSGKLDSKTETTSVVTEVINSMDYNTGYQYSVTGTNIQNMAAGITPSTTSGNSNTINGVTSTWTTRCCQQAKLVNRRQHARISVHGNSAGSGAVKSYDYKQDHRDKKRYGKYFNLLTVGVLSLFANPSLAGDVGGVSATANPIANSSGSVTNQAIQVLQGPYITNTYGNGIQCQGPTLNVTPFMTRTGSYQQPFEDYYNDPVYDTSDLNNDGVLDNPGKILYYKPIRTGQKNNFSWNGGLSATLSIPLDQGLQRRCKQAADAQIAIQEQLLANRRLDFEIARLKKLRRTSKAGITFRPGSDFARDLCGHRRSKCPMRVLLHTCILFL